MSAPTRSFNIVIPMAGRGQRFRDAGFEEPKPLIPVLDRPMYAWAAESLPLEHAARLVFVILEEHAVRLAADIDQRYAAHNPIVHVLPDVTEGQLATVLTAREYLLSDLPLIVYNADTICRGALAALDDDPSVDGLVGVFRAEGTHWSFARTDDAGRVLETAEKRRISDWATTGLYHFTRTSDFLEHADRAVAEDDRVGGEFYVAPLYNRMIAAGGHIRIDPALDVEVLGTPAELDRFLAGDVEDLATVTGDPKCRPRHVLHVMNGAGGGAALSTLALIEGLQRFGVRSSAVCHPAGSPNERQRIDRAAGGRVLFTPLYWWNRKIRTAPWKRPLFELWQGVRTGWAQGSGRRIARFGESVGADLVHTNTILTPDGAIAARKLDVPHVWHVRELTGAGQPFQLRRSGAALADYLRRHADLVVANSPSSAAPLVGLLPPERLRAVPNAIDVARFTAATRAEREARAGRPVVAMVANLTSRVKNHPLFLEMAARITTEGVDLRIYGHDPCDGGRRVDSSYCREIHDRIGTLGLHGRIAFPGFDPHPEAIMREIDILVHPVAHESFGRIVVEAMAAEVPVVGIAAGGVGDLVTDGRTGLLVPAGGDRELAIGLAAAVDRLLADPVARQVLGREGRRVAERDYSIGPHLERMVAAYETAVENHRGTAPRS